MKSLILTFLFCVNASASVVYGPGSSPGVTNLAGRGVSGAAPADTNVLTWDAALNAWKPAAGGGGGLTSPVAVADGGTGQTTANAGFNALSPMTTGGDLIYGGASGVATRLANGSAGQVLTSGGTTVAPTWETPAGGASQWTTSGDGIYFNGSQADDDAVVVIGDTSTGRLANEMLRVAAQSANTVTFMLNGPGAGNGMLEVITLASDRLSLSAINGANNNVATLLLNHQGGQVEIGNAANGITMKGYTSCTALTTDGSDVVGCTVSDERLKKDIVPFERGSESVRALNTKTFRFKNPSDLGILHHGFIAQDVMKTLPEAVIMGSDGYYQLDTTAIIAAQNNALKEAFNRIEALESKLGVAQVKASKVIAMSKVREAKEWKPSEVPCVGGKKFCDGMNKRNAEKLAKIRELKKATKGL